MSQRAVVASVLGAVVIAFSSILVALADVSPTTAAFWRCAYALPVVCGGVLLVSGTLEDGAYGANPTRGALFGIATGVAYAAYLLVQRQGSMDLRRLADAPSRSSRSGRWRPARSCSVRSLPPCSCAASRSSSVA